MKVVFVIFMSSVLLAGCNNTYSKSETGTNIQNSPVGGSVSTTSGGQTVTPTANPSATTTITR